MTYSVSMGGDTSTPEEEKVIRESLRGIAEKFPNAVDVIIWRGSFTGEEYIHGKKKPVKKVIE